MTPNYFAYFSLLAWPFVAVFLFSKKPFNQALIWTILGAFLLLPVFTVIKFEMIPALDKYTVPNIAAYFGCVFIARRRPRLFHGFGIVEILVVMLIVGPFITSELNGDAIHIGETALPGVGPYDAASTVVAELLFFLPFILGRQFLRNAADSKEILRTIVIAALLYSLPVLFEIRMSPQLNAWIYGYAPFQFAQQFRDGGFRPAVFMGHGLTVAFFLMTAVVASAALWRAKINVTRVPAIGVTTYLSLVLVLCKTLSSLIYAAVLVPLVRWVSPNRQIYVAVVLAVFALSYPALRILDLVPTTTMVDMAASVNADRGGSLKYRFDQEDQLLKHALERVWFGWGRFGRNRVYSETGVDMSVTDGEWIGRLGSFGVFGFVAEFGLLAISVFRAATALRFSKSMEDNIVVAALALVVAVNLINMLPNSSISPWMWLIAGALLGRAEAIHAIGTGSREIGIVSNQVAAKTFVFRARKI